MSTFKPKFTTVAAIEKETQLAANQKHNWNTRVQNLALSVVYHYAQHGTKSVVINFVEGITAADGVVKSSLRSYMEFACIAEISAEDMVHRAGKKAKDINIDQAAAVKWYDFKRDTKKANAKTLGELREYIEKQGKKSVKAGKFSQATLDALVADFEELIVNEAAA